ncbi:putative zinc finger protein At1g68190 isoform X2 [Mercurialis annua]|nr:putative zinc finger protein At1g68190 isoform X2 [Mercurialis annua]
MEKICEFCTALRPVVYCKADAAFLCLSCDARIHSANALSNRHLRTLLCDACRNHPAYARCMDHRMFVCRGCDQSIHGVSSPHQRRILSCYLGCPSAKDFAALWGFQLDDVDKNDVRNNQLFAASFDTRQQIGSSSRTSRVGMSIKQNQISGKGRGQQNNDFILQQILDLKKLQLNEMDHKSSYVIPEDGDDLLRHSQDLGDNDCLLHDLKIESSQLPFSQPENLPLPSTAANPLLGESFWQCRSPNQSSQLWSQNMQDLGVCEDNASHDDFNMPDVDITFRNFEELFGTEQDLAMALLDDTDASCSSFEKDMSLDTSQNRNARAREETSAASSTYVGLPIINRNMGPPNQVYSLPASLDSPRTVHQSYSAISFSVSRFSAESNGNDYLDSGFSPYITAAELSHVSPDVGFAHSAAKENAMARYKEKKKARM